MLVALTVALSITVGGHQAPAAATYELAAVQVAGAKRYTVEDVTRVSGLAVGKPLTVADLQPAAERLASSGLFKTVQYRYITAARRMTVTFEIDESDWTVPVIFDNFVWFEDDELIAAVRRDVPSFDGTAPPSEGVPDLIIASLQKLLAERGIPGTAGVVPQTDLKTRSLRYLFSVKDPAPKVCALAFHGASAERLPELMDATRALPGNDYSRYYVMGMAQGTLLDIYHRRGHWRATLAAPAVRADAAECTGVSVVLQVNEGPVYTWAGAQWSGTAAIGPADLDRLLAMRPGDVADGSKIKDGLLRVWKAYGRIGHVVATADHAPRLDDEGRRAVFEMTVSEGPQFRMGRVEFIGMPEAVAEALRKAWKLAPGAVFDAAYPPAYEVKEVFSRRRPGGKSPVMEMEIDRTSRVVNIRFVLE